MFVCYYHFVLAKFSDLNLFVLGTNTTPSVRKKRRAVFSRMRKTKARYCAAVNCSNNRATDRGRKALVLTL